ncbi:MAG: hypothetical protein WCE54_08120 [Ignavibacteriaceae bacterium]
MFKKGFVLNLFLSLAALISFSCNAPRDNPLDPNGPKADLVQIKPNLVQFDGTVQTISAPLTGIPGVSVFWIPGDAVVKSDVSGNFTINNIKPGDNGLLIFQKDSYSSDTVKISWENSTTILLYDSIKISLKNAAISLPIINLNKIPTLDSYSIYSEVANQSGQSNIAVGQMADLVFKVKINDSDNDIDSVFVKNDMLNFTGGLELQSKLYQGTFTASKLNVNSLDETVGYNFDVWVIDSFKRTFLVGSNKVARVIKNGVDIIYPNDDSLAISLPVDLTWNQYSNGFPFTYKVEIYNATNPQPIFTQDNIPPDQTILVLDTSSVVSGDYFWAVSVVDKFLDSYKSLPGRFQIK